MEYIDKEVVLEAIGEWNEGEEGKEFIAEVFSQEWLSTASRAFFNSIVGEHFSGEFACLKCKPESSEQCEKCEHLHDIPSLGSIVGVSIGFGYFLGKKCTEKQKVKLEEFNKQFKIER